MMPQTPAARPTAPDDWQSEGACMCATFSNRGRTLHNYGQPGCRHEQVTEMAAQVGSC